METHLAFLPAVACPPCRQLIIITPFTTHGIIAGPGEIDTDREQPRNERQQDFKEGLQRLNKGMNFNVNEMVLLFL
mgnify:CR=1 FL=1